MCEISKRKYPELEESKIFMGIFILKNPSTLLPLGYKLEIVIYPFGLLDWLEIDPLGVSVSVVIKPLPLYISNTILPPCKSVIFCPVVSCQTIPDATVRSLFVSLSHELV